MLSSSAGIPIIEAAQEPTTCEERKTCPSALAENQSQPSLEEMLHSLDFHQKLPSQSQEFPGDLVGAEPLEIYEQYLEALRELLGSHAEGIVLPSEHCNESAFWSGSNGLPVNWDANSPESLEKIKEMLVLQQERIVSLLKTHLQDLSIAHITHENGDSQEEKHNFEDGDHQSSPVFTNNGLFSGPESAHTQY
ncbi:hypothetical protein BSKO_13288 [Bryopsis sp. KO-2023]|nr:hypothetical protein BSKO_13288 [Bryopsis sp. KO-2023]